MYTHGQIFACTHGHTRTVPGSLCLDEFIACKLKASLSLSATGTPLYLQRVVESEEVVPTQNHTIPLGKERREGKKEGGRMGGREGGREGEGRVVGRAVNDVD